MDVSSSTVLGAIDPSGRHPLIIYMKIMYTHTHNLTCIGNTPSQPSLGYLGYLGYLASEAITGNRVFRPSAQKNNEHVCFHIPQ